MNYLIVTEILKCMRVDYGTCLYLKISLDYYYCIIRIHSLLPLHSMQPSFLSPCNEFIWTVHIDSMNQEIFRDSGVALSCVKLFSTIDDGKFNNLNKMEPLFRRYYAEKDEYRFVLGCLDY